MAPAVDPVLVVVAADEAMAVVDAIIGAVVPAKRVSGHLLGMPTTMGGGGMMGAVEGRGIGARMMAEMMTTTVAMTGTDDAITAAAGDGAASMMRSLGMMTGMVSHRVTIATENAA